ncbi:MAG: hypothetical protein J0L75_01810 [Spirochaetes bacterium]|nr:hypothetical protein [Spirochaetota bacterium]
MAAGVRKAQFKDESTPRDFGERKGAVGGQGKENLGANLHEFQGEQKEEGDEATHQRDHRIVEKAKGSPDGKALVDKKGIGNQNKGQAEHQQSEKQKVGRSRVYRRRPVENSIPGQKVKKGYKSNQKQSANKRKEGPPERIAECFDGRFLDESGGMSLVFTTFQIKNSGIRTNWVAFVFFSLSTGHFLKQRQERTPP